MPYGIYGSYTGDLGLYSGFLIQNMVGGKREYWKEQGFWSPTFVCTLLMIRVTSKSQ